MNNLILVQLKNLEDYDLKFAVKTAEKFGYSLVYRNILENPLSIYQEYKGLAGIIKENRMIWESEEKRLINKRVPMITLGIDLSTDIVKIGNIAGMHFLEHGFTKFAWLNIGNRPEDLILFGSYEKVISDAGYSCQKINFSEMPTFAELSKAFSKLDKSTSIFIAHDSHFQWVYEALMSLKYKIPEDIAVLSKGNHIRYAHAMPVSLSSIDLNRAALLSLGVEEIVAQWQGKSNYQKRRLEPLGVQMRQSTNIISSKNTDIQKALNYIYRYATSGINAADVVDQVSCSRSTLDLKFQKHLKQSIPEVIRSVKLRYAKIMLVESNKAAAQIAQESGFCHTAHLTKLLKDDCGMTVRSFRNLYKKQD